MRVGPVRPADTSGPHESVRSARVNLIEALMREPFGAAAARSLVRRREMFQEGKIYRRGEISETLRATFVELGGDPKTTTEGVSRVLKKLLHDDDFPFRRVEGKAGLGRYRFLGRQPTTGVDASPHRGLQDELRNVRTAVDEVQTGIRTVQARFDAWVEGLTDMVQAVREVDQRLTTMERMVTRTAEPPAE